MRPSLLRATMSGLSFPNALNTGATLPGTLFPITGSSTNAAAAGGANANWSWSGTAWTFSGGNPVLSGLSIGTTGITVNASNTTVQSCHVAGQIVVGYASPVSNTLIENCVIAQAAGGSGEGIKLGGGGADIPTNTTIQDCTISGTDAGPNRLSNPIDDNYANSVNTVILRCNIFWCRDAINLTAGLVQDCYIHDFGYISGDHLDGVSNGGTGAGTLTIRHNTILMGFTQTSPLTLGGAGFLLQNVLIDSNLLAGGGYCLYGGLQSAGASRTDTGLCSTSTGTPNTVGDTAAKAADNGALISGTNIPAGTTIVAVTPLTGYTISGTGVTASGTGLTFTVSGLNAPSRSDAACTANGTTAVQDAHACQADVGATVTGPGVPLFTTIASAVNGTSYTLSNSVTTGSGLTFVIRYTNNIVVTNNRISQMFFPSGGYVAVSADYDYNVGSNVWANNCYHDSGIIIPSH